MTEFKCPECGKITTDVTHVCATPEDTAHALVRAYRDRYGYKNPAWVDDLYRDWMNGTDVTRLGLEIDGMNIRRVRNVFGPTWLYENYGDGDGP